MAKGDKEYYKRCNNLKNHISNDNLEQAKKAIIYGADVVDALRIDKSKITSIRMLKFLYKKLEIRALKEDQSPSAAPLFDAIPGKAAVAVDIVKLLLSKPTVLSDAINVINKAQDPKVAAEPIELQAQQEALEFIAFANEIYPEFDIETDEKIVVHNLPAFRFLMSNQYSPIKLLKKIHLSF